MEYNTYSDNHTILIYDNTFEGQILVAQQAHNKPTTSVNSVVGNDHCLMWESYKKRT